MKNRVKGIGFSIINPIVSCFYLGIILFMTICIENYILIGLSGSISILYLLFFSGKNTLLKSLKYKFIVIMGIIILMPLFYHRGKIVLFYLPIFNTITLEAFIYGIRESIKILAIMIWIEVWDYFLNSRGLMSVLGLLTKRGKLIILISFRFYRELRKKIGEIYYLEKIMYNKKGLSLYYNAFIRGVNITLESTVIKSNSMKCRGYREDRKRSSSESLKFTIRDVILSIILFSLFIYGVLGKNTFIISFIGISLIPIILYKIDKCKIKKTVVFN